MTLHEVSEAAAIIQEAADPDANIIFGTVIDRLHQGSVKVTVIATGFARDQTRPVHDRAAVEAPMPLQAPPARTLRELQLQEQRSTTQAEGPPQAEPKRFFRNEAPAALDFDANDEGFTPNFARMKDDLDIPAFLRKQMD